jgi:hypothetical protein
VIPWLKNGLHDSDDAVRLTVAGSLVQQLSHLPKGTQRRS